MTAKKYEDKFNRYDGLSYRAIAEIMGISKSRVEQLEKIALKKLAHPKNRRLIKQLLA